MKSGEDSEAVLHFEQVVKYNKEPFLSGNALFEIAKMQIRNKLLSFYDAHHNL